MPTLDSERLTCPECGSVVSLEQASIVPFPCPNCGDTVVVTFKYDKLYRAASLVGALVIPYLKGWQGPFFFIGFIACFLALLLIALWTFPRGPARLEKASPYLQTLGIGPRKRG